MGNQQESQSWNYGKIYIKTVKPFYFGGEIVTGSVYLQMLLEGFPSEKLILKVKGKEFCQWEEQEMHQQGQKTTYKTVYRKGEKEYLCHKFPLFQGFINKIFAELIQLSLASFPINQDLPGSFHFQGPNYKADIKYKVKAEMESHNSSIKSIKHCQTLIVREPIKTYTQAQVGEHNVNIKTWCCLNQGVMNMCVFDRNNYLPGDKASLQVDIDNTQCNLQINQVKGCLFHYLTLYDSQHRRKQIVRCINQTIVPGVAPHAIAVGDNRKIMYVQLGEISNDKDSVQPSASGDLIKSMYELVAVAEVDGCICCNENPKVSVPITIVSPVPVVFMQVQQPPDWNPQVFQIFLFQQAEFVFDNQYQYSKNPGFQANFNQNPQMNQIQINM